MTRSTGNNTQTCAALLLTLLTTSVVTAQAQNGADKAKTAGKALNGAGKTSAQAEQAERAEWTARLNGVKEGDWRTARGEVSGMAGLPPGRAIALLRGIWPALTATVVKSEIAKAFAGSEHPDTLRFLALAAGDAGSHAAPANDVMYSANIALLLPYNTPTADTLARLRAFADRSLDDARAERLREIAARIADAPPEFLVGLGHTFRMAHSEQLREQAASAGVFAALDKRLMAPNVDTKAQRPILEALENFEWPEAMLTRVILPVATSSPDEYTRSVAFGIMARAGYAPAYDALKRRLIQEAQEPDAGKKAWEAGWPLTRTVPVFGRADIIPTLIGIIAADNTYNTISNVGSSGLSALTGVDYHPSHDGNWWRLWWERNHDKLPADTQNLSIPDFPHSAAYHVPIPRDILLDQGRYRQYCLDRVMEEARKADGGAIDTYSIVALHDPTLIPALIGLVASDNTYNTVYNVGAFVLGDLTGVPYEDIHDGNWWRLWWDAHRAELPENTRNLMIPDLPPTPAYKSPLPADLHQSAEKTRSYLLSTIRQAIADGKIRDHVFTLRALAATKDPTVILPLIEMMPPDDPAPDVVAITANLSGNGLEALTGVEFDPTHGQAWWRQWWMEHHADVEQKIAAYHPQPTYIALKYAPAKPRQASPFVMDAGYNPRIGVAAGLAGRQAEAEPEDIRDVPSQRIALNDDPQRVYRLVGLKAGNPAPAGGYKLLVALPGGDGSDEFRAFIRRMKKYALPDDMLIAQIIAPKWNDWQAQNLVWPTRINPFYAMKFPTEQLIEDAIADAAKRARIDPRQIYALAWSSSGPAVYTALASPHSSLRGAFVAMSVFRDTGLPDSSLLKGRRVFLYHSPQDFIKIGQAQEAETYLRAHGASVQLRQYQGGHGWTGDTYGDIRAGLDWLTQSDKKP